MSKRVCDDTRYGDRVYRGCGKTWDTDYQYGACPHNPYRSDDDTSARAREVVLEASNDHVAAHLAADNAGFDSIEQSFEVLGEKVDRLVRWERARTLHLDISHDCTLLDACHEYRAAREAVWANS